MSVTARKTPGVYIQELDAFGNAVVPVPTAIPVFIGYTDQSSYNGKNLVNRAVRITSLADYYAIFVNVAKEAPKIQFSITQVGGAPTDGETKEEKKDLKPAPKADTKPAPKADPKADPKGETKTEGEPSTAKTPDFSVGGADYNLTTTTVNYRMHSAIHFFYENGGGTCYIISTGAYDYTLTALSESGPFEDALKVLEKEEEPTMIVIPDAVELKDDTQKEWGEKYKLCYGLQSQMINHCGEMLKRVALLDVPGGFNEPKVGDSSVVGFRDNVNGTLPKFNSYAAAYYPWLHTSVNQLGDISYKNIATESQSTVTTILNNEFPQVKDKISGNMVDNPMKQYVTALFGASSDVEESTTPAKKGSTSKTATKPVTKPISQEKADAVLKNLSKSYKLLLNHMLDHLNLMPPSAAMAGIYTTVDNNEGVWVAPANVAVQSVVSPAEKIDLQAQEDLNVPLDGKSVCAIRSFPGYGVLVWGARTMDGNSNDWRYVNVRRTLIYIEQSIKEAARAYVFAPNDANTWVSVKSMISNFLLGLWNQGGLVGPKPADAFSVSVGLGSTMTGEDILMGKMIVAVKVAVSHPAEFIEITFQQEMQKG
ncbi:phage tail sheath family protein [Spongiimicrobium salis]|uniref:phage tail sheath family protein n=1 Tax=Spongiimicrobium salis TaxID=1667022 RepID=UPI00374D580D